MLESVKSGLEFSREFTAQRNTQTIIDGKVVTILKGSEIKILCYKLNKEDREPISGDVILDGTLIGFYYLESLKDLISELTDELIYLSND